MPNMEIHLVKEENKNCAISVQAQALKMKLMLHKPARLRARWSKRGNQSEQPVPDIKTFHLKGTFVVCKNSTGICFTTAYTGGKK